MSFAESMMSTLRSNKSIMLDKSSHFKKTKGGYDSENSVQFDFPESTPKILREIRDRLIMERKQRLIKIVGVSIIVFTILSLIITYII